jgi:putative transposase
MLEINNKNISIRTQCKLLGINRSSVYYNSLINNESELANLIQEIYLSSDCRYGYRKITKDLHTRYNLKTNHKKVLKIMQEIGIQGIYPRKYTKTTIKDNNAVYPYLLKDLKISKPNEVWATDITYIRMPSRFMYFIAIIDLYSRYIIAYELSSSLEATFCINTLNNALLTGTPLIFNTDQGSQFTAHDFINILQKANIKISMDHKGRCFDNIYVERLWRTLKQEAIYYYRPETLCELETCIENFVDWYNNHRLHQSLNYKTPKSVYNELNVMH